MIFYHFTTLMLPQGSEKGGRVIVNVFRVFLFVLLVLSKSQFKMKTLFIMLSRPR